MNLQEARQRVYYYLDDDGTGTLDGARWTLAEVDQHLRHALDAVCTTYAAQGGTRLDELVDATTTTSGYLDLLSYRPLQIQSVALKSGNTFLPVSPVASREFQQTCTTVQTFQIRMVRSPVFPTVTTDQILYGPNLSFESIDELICLKAARAALTKDKEVDTSLEKQYMENLGALLMTENVIHAYDFPTARLVTCPFVYQYLPYRLYIGYRGL